MLPDPPGFSSCGEYVEASISTWLQLGGRRVDSSASYHNQLYTGIAMAASGIPRADLFLTSKVGPFLAMGGAEAELQFAHTLGVMNTTYVDLVLIHWPTCASGGGCSGAPTSEPTCQAGTAGYDERACRLATWRALVAIWGRGGARAIGVSNYNQTHLQEIMDAGLPLPAVNQLPFNLYHSGDLGNGLFDFMRAHNVRVCVCGGGGRAPLPPPAHAACRARSSPPPLRPRAQITYNTYSPFAVPDRRSYKPPMARTPLEDPVLAGIAAAHGTSPAQATLAWQWARGMVFNPRSQNAAHMLQNLAFEGILLSEAEVAALDARPQY